MLCCCVQSAANGSAGESCVSMHTFVFLTSAFHEETVNGKCISKHLDSVPAFAGRAAWTSSAVWAQAGTGELTGLVADPSGAVIANDKST